MTDQETWRPFKELPPEEQREFLATIGEPHRDYEPIHPGSGTNWRGIGRKIWAPVLAVGAFLAKFGALFFKFKFVTVALSMLVSIGGYALLWGWQFGVGFVALIFCHEMGHVLEARRQGLPVSAPLFIPFLGAMITLKEMPHNAWREAQVALAGPLVGSLAAAACWGIGAYTDSDFWRALAFAGFFINLFNLIPIVPLDGGRAVAALHPLVWGLGLAGLLALTFYRPNPFLILILVLGGLEVAKRWRTRHLAEMQDYYRVAPSRRLAVAVVYLGLAAALALGMAATQVPH
jgi:Zn-dependent protease